MPGQIDDIRCATSSLGRGGTETSSDREPIAIVGIGCRFPGGATSPEGFWELLRDGRDAISEVPPDRWSLKAFYDPEPGTPGKTNARWGGFIDGIDEFDAEFFGISPREAARMDPQQRLLLESAVEALHDAGQPLEKVSGTPGSVYIGISSYDYTVIQQGPGDRLKIDAHSNTGGALSIAANRISYFLNLQGASLALDTACSSALVAVHLACHDLWREESTLALAGGVNVLIKPEPFVGFSRLSMLSPDGRCKAFDASANGFVRSEGAGIVVLKKLSRALRDRDRIYAVILATGSNQDGRTSSMTVPSADAQETLLRETCRKGGVDPRDVQFVEAHGTGTPVGDPIEATALGNVFGAGRKEGDYCTIGSVKTNIGHLEPAAGIAGLIKVALALHHRAIPANLHFHEPSPTIPFDKLKLRVARSLEPLATGNQPVVAGVNSFGFGGTNAHVLLQEAPTVPEDLPDALPRDETIPTLIPLSARGPQALRGLADSYARFLDDGGAGSNLSLRDVSWTAGTRRSHFEHRLAIVAETRAELLESLRAFASGETRPGSIADRCSPSDEPGVAFVCTGQGPQWWAMGRELLEREPVFREKVEQCDAIVRSLGKWSLIDELTRDEGASRMEETAIAQPSIFALQVGLAALWRSWGIEPDALIGHSVGEVAAAHLAGVLDLEDAVSVIFHRGRCMDFAEAHGKMLAVGLRLDEAQELIRGREDQVSVAAINSPTSITLSGDGKALEPIAEELERRGVFQRFLRVNYAFHSPLMDPMRKELVETLQGIETRPALRPIVSTVTGQLAEGPEFGSEYWWQNVRRTVRFANGVGELLRKDYRLFVELGPHPVLSASVLECDVQQTKKTIVLPTLRRGDGERRTMLLSLARLHTLGKPVCWDRVGSGRGRLVDLPTYAWNRERFWSESEASKRSRLSDDVHPLLGQRLTTSHATWQNQLDLRVLRYVADHRVQGHVLLPGTAFLEMTLAAGRELYGDGICIFEDVELSRALFLRNDETVSIELDVDPADSTVTIVSRPHESDQTWSEHARGKLRMVARDDAHQLDVRAIRERCPVEIGRTECYERLSAMGLQYGPRFQGVERVWCGDDEALGRIVAPTPLHRTWDDYEFHPAVMDACLHPVLVAVSQATGSQTVYLPVALEKLRVSAHAERELWSYVRILSHSRRAVLADIRIVADSGKVVMEMLNARCQAVDQGASQGLDDLVYEYRWQAARLPGRAPQSDLPTPDRLVGVARPEAERLEVELAVRERTRRFETDLDPHCTYMILEAYRELGHGLVEGQRFTVDDLAEGLGSMPHLSRLLERHCRLLEEDGILRGSESGWEVGKLPSAPETSWAELFERHPAFFAELSLLDRTRRHLAGVLRGEVNPLEVIFPEGSLALAEHIYQDSPTLRFFNLIAQRTISAMLEQLPADRELRVLEIGAGTGGLTSYVVPRLPAERTSYVFTDVSNHFFAKAEEKFRDYPFLTFKRLDIEGDPAEQEFEPNTYDLILASDALHATADLRETLNNVKKLLAPEGLLLTIEGSRPVRWIDLAFGMTGGWWKFTDRDLRPDHALLPPTRWATVLEELGFSQCQDILGFDDPALQHHVLLARGPVIPLTDSASAPTTSAQLEREPARWLIFADGEGIGARLARELEARGERCIVVHRREGFRAIDADRLESGVELDDLRAVVRSFATADLLENRGVVHLWNVDSASASEATSDDLNETLRVGCLSVVHLVRALTETFEDHPPRLWIVTRGAESVEDRVEPVEVLQSPVWGLNRVILNETPRLRSTVLDLAMEPAENEEFHLAEEVLADDAEDEIALRGGSRYVHRFARMRDRRQRIRESDGWHDGFRLETSALGVIDKLSFRAAERRRPRPGEVEIEVMASGLNFSDVMKALGLYPGLEDGPIPLGIECAGRIAAVGEGVENLEPGAEVVAIAPFSFASYVTTSSHLVAPKPAGLSFEEAATIPIAFLTAHYALEHLGQMSGGERVLVHSATGGVGLAAIQLAQRAGAEIYATAGTPAKRDLLRTLGIEHVMDSRSVDFADEIMEKTAGEGIDLVLNSLAGEAITKGLAVLRDNGRFLEIGKRDIYQNSRVGLRPFRKNLSFMGIDLDRELRRRPELLSRQFRELLKRFDDGTLRPLVHRVFPASNVAAAFRHMAQAKHVGKVVISLQDQIVPVAPTADRTVSFDADKAYLITGGLGGFGLLLAQWMVDQGARHLVLMGRGGARTPEATSAVNRLRESGSDVVVARADVSKAEDIAKVIEEIEARGHELGGVIHAAMVLDDSLVLNMTEQHLRNVWGPKVMGAWHLHHLTAGRSLDFFVSFSSISAIFGAGGQGNYASANAFLDALSRYRRALEQPALTVSWGYLGEVGFVASHGAIAERFETMGVKSFTPKEALALLSRFLDQDPVHVGVMRIDWRRWRQTAAAFSISPRFADLVNEGGEDADDGQAKSSPALRAALLSADPSQRREIIEPMIREQVAKVLGASPAKLDAERPLSDLGLDSLMAVELKNWIEGEVGVTLPSVELLRGPSVADLTSVLLDQLAKRDEVGAEVGAVGEPSKLPRGSEREEREAAEKMLARLDEMSEEEVDAALGEMGSDADVTTETPLPPTAQ